MVRYLLDLLITECILVPLQQRWWGTFTDIASDGHAGAVTAVALAVHDGRLVVTESARAHNYFFKLPGCGKHANFGC